jgi:energy-coupling factor transporter ATP-binding protein EcfA2
MIALLTQRDKDSLIQTEELQFHPSTVIMVTHQMTIIAHFLLRFFHH